jgi:hypothetical protein
MKYLKTFEDQIIRNDVEEKILYLGDNFRIIYNHNDLLCYDGVERTLQCSAILYMAHFIRNKNDVINDPELRKIKLRKKAKDYDIDSLTLDNIKYKNIQIFRSSDIEYFIGHKLNGKWGKPDKGIPLNIYMDLTKKYYPIISEAIKKSNTLGDVIDEFKIIYKNIMEELKFLLTVNQYNL